MGVFKDAAQEQGHGIFYQAAQEQAQKKQGLINQGRAADQGAAKFLSNIIPGQQIGQSIGTLAGYGIAGASDAINKIRGKGPTTQMQNYDLSSPSVAQTTGDAINAVSTPISLSMGGGVGKSVLQRIGSAGLKYGAAGAVQGLGHSLSSGQTDVGNIAKDTAIGGVVGGALGAGGQAIGEGVGKIGQALQKKPEDVLKYVTPTGKDIPDEQYKQFLHQGRITPSTLTQPAKYVLSPGEKNIALKYSGVVDKNPVNTSINIGNKIGELDDKVGQFLRANNGIFNKGELKNSIASAMEDINDITIPEERLTKAKQMLVDNFVKSVGKNDMETLWQTRKDYDQAINSAFKGAPTLQKEVKTTLRNAVQDFIAERTPDGVYKSQMKDMTDLFRLRDVVDVKAAKGKAIDLLADWAKKNPRTAKVIGLTVGAIGAGTVLGGLANVTHAGE